MKTTSLALALSALLLTACHKKNPNVSADCYCADSTKKDLCDVIPHEVPMEFTVGYPGVLDSLHQTPFDIFSWQSFVALNWPADEKGNPIPGKFTDHPTNKRVWEYYLDASEIFSAGENGSLMMLLSQSHTADKKVFHMMSKSPHALNPDGSFAEADGNPLIDRNLNFAVFEERINPDEVNYIRSHHMTTKAGIIQNAPVDLPEGDAKNVGAIEIKSSWRILDPEQGDDTSRYYHRHAVIYVAADNSSTGKEMLIDAIVGLVGMHIVHKTERFPDMVWSTFEHIDNVPENNEEAQRDLNKRYSFYNQNCLTCPVNTPPVAHPGDSGNFLWAAQPPYAEAYGTVVRGEGKGDAFGTQVQRTYPIYWATQYVNQAWRSKLKGTVWENYILIGSQWRRKADTPPFLNTDIPDKLGNATMETYKPATSSCLTCHAAAKVVYNKDTVPTDFSFLFKKAK